LCLRRADHLTIAALRFEGHLALLFARFFSGRASANREHNYEDALTVALAMLAGAAIGAAAVQGLHAQAKPPVYQITEIDAANPATYVKDYVPRAQAVIKAAGGRLLAGGPARAVDGEPPKPRIAVTEWDSLEKFQAYRNSAAFKELLPIREKLAKFRSFTVEGLAS
jgi:uncharacterized protein (DUF1330 family)